MIRPFIKQAKLAGMLALNTGLMIGCAVLQDAEKGDRKAAKNHAVDPVIAEPSVPQCPPAEPLLPVQCYDRAGHKIPYQIKPNPYLSSAIEVPERARTLFGQARRAARQEQWDAALSVLRRLTVAYPNLSGAWLMQGRVLEAMQRPDEAAEAYVKAIALNPHNVNAYVGQALLQRKRGQFVQAEKSYRAALSVWPDFAAAHLNLAVLYDLYLNRPVAAQKHYEAYLFLTPQNDERVARWLLEVRRRTGIDKSFIDRPDELPGVGQGHHEALNEAQTVSTDNRPGGDE